MNDDALDIQAIHRLQASIDTLIDLWNTSPVTSELLEAEFEAMPLSDDQIDAIAERVAQKLTSAYSVAAGEILNEARTSTPHDEWEIKQTDTEP